ncbi:uncharacterized protein B0I36DRAFT_325355 [Microdochium trichocladiopsis]|uniref:NAD(P)-binding domain-containing protein n=1 Tax=Microdochium trichocladiopsis TaxID=1682393 RepID=A0A9P8Y725_9PEZI|nr:uncharacterized protein B0I36DRAFT_325355 [Microdochium trichocladiopsis]KAH7029257.1 hypothetical protein B0I36DRAFT_325355 [Microdochium trichocladiopsis]
MAQPVKNVMLVGASGLFGAHVLHALQSHSPQFTITALTRSSSTASFPASLNTIPIEDTYPLPDLIAAFTGQDAVILTLPGRPTSELQIRMIDAAVAAGVRRFVPSMFGNNTSREAGEMVGLYADENLVREHLRRKSRERHAKGLEGGGFTYTILHPGQFFDWGLESGWLSFDVKGKKAVVYGSGERRWSTSTIGTAAEAVVRCFETKEARDRELRVASFTVSQNELLGVFERLTGENWEVGKVDCAEARKRAREMAEGEYWDRLKMEIMVLLGEDEGGDRGQEFERDSDGLWNERLGLPRENLTEVLERVVKKTMIQ